MNSNKEGLQLLVAHLKEFRNLEAKFMSSIFSVPIYEFGGPM